MASKTAAEKLLIKPRTSVWVSHAEHRALLGPLPDGVTAADGPADATTAVLFAGDAEDLDDVLTAHAADLDQPAYVWFAYPKGGRSDLNRDSLWPIVADRTGMRPITQIALDDTWSALRFRPLKSAEEPFSGGRPRRR
jgi:hypothetical protein